MAQRARKIKVHFRLFRMLDAQFTRIYLSSRCHFRPAMVVVLSRFTFPHKNWKSDPVSNAIRLEPRAVVV